MSIDPFLIAVGLTLSAKLVVEYLSGLPMRIPRLVLQPSERAVRARVLIGMLVLAVFMLAFSVQAADRDSELARLEANRAKWVERGINDYWVRLRDETCLCLYGPYYGPIRLLVRDGKIRKAIYHGERRDGYWPGRAVEIDTALKATIEEVFENAKRVILTVPDGAYRIEYDREFGFPVVIDVDIPDWQDEQWRLVVDGFRPLR